MIDFKNICLIAICPKCNKVVWGGVFRAVIEELSDVKGMREKGYLLRWMDLEEGRKKLSEDLADGSCEHLG
jgi:hypothetical protein